MKKTNSAFRMPRASKIMLSNILDKNTAAIYKGMLIDAQLSEANARLNSPKQDKKPNEGV